MTVNSRFGLLAGIVSGLAFAAPTPSKTATAPAPKAAETAPNSPNSSQPTTTGPSTTTATVSAPSESKFFGVFEIRPSYGVKSKDTETEDTIEAGYQFNAKTKLSYAQFFKTDVFISSRPGKGVNLRGDGGWLRLRVNDIWTSANKKSTLAYQGRFYTDFTDASQNGTGNIGTIYNAIRFTQDLSIMKLTVAEIPMFHITNKAGFLDDGKLRANTGYQNRVEIIADIDIVKNLSLSVPIIIDMYSRQTVTGASNSGKWEHKYWAWPELNYSINGVHTVGVGFRTESLVASDLSKFTLGEGFNKGTLQAIWTVSL